MNCGVIDTKKQPLISVIVPVYNAENYLERCIGALQNQVYSNIQIILVDDGSIDSSLRICEQQAKKDKRIIVLHQENKGVSAARNLGLSKATGELIAFCDSDDMYKPEMLSTLLEIMKKSGADLCGCSYLRVKLIDDKYFYNKAYEYEIFSVNYQKAIEKIIYDSDGYIWNKLFKREIIGNNQFSEEIAVLEDELFLLEYIMNCKSVAFTTEPLYIYWDNPASVINQTGITKRRLSSIFAREKILELVKRERVSEEAVTIVWNDLIKSYAISFKKLLLKVYEREFLHMRRYILTNYIERKKEYKRNNSWNIKELVYLWVLDVFSVLSKNHIEHGSR